MPSAKKRRRLRVLVVPANSHPEKGKRKDLIIDEDDYLIVKEIVSLCEIHDEDVETVTRDVMETREEDEERRLWKLSLPSPSYDTGRSWFHFYGQLTREGRRLNNLLGRLQSLERLDLSSLGYIEGLPDKICDLTGLKTLDLHHTSIDHLPASIGKLQKLEHLNLKNAFCLEALPNEIGNLTNLQKLNLDYCIRLGSLPSSIVNLKRLEELLLYKTKSLWELPENIGLLTNLKELDIQCSKVWRLPPTNGQLQKLEYLRAGNTALPNDIGCLTNLKEFSVYGQMCRSLPVSVGQLQKLEKLGLRSSEISSLPPSIGELQELKVLNLSRTRQLSTLPCEVGNLSSLKVLDLEESYITSLPPSIGGLQELEVLNLSRTRQLSTLPCEVGNLSGLKALSLYRSNIRSLPDSVGKMKSLMSLSLDSGQKKTNGNLLSTIVHSCPLLGSFGYCPVIGLTSSANKESDKVCHALACNRARFRMKSGSVINAHIQPTPKLWPLFLDESIHLFDDYSGKEMCMNKSSYSHTPHYSVQKPDAIFHILTGNMESFLLHLINRTTETMPPVTKGT